jgi:hypothetical protein
MNLLLTRPREADWKMSAPLRYAVPTPSFDGYYQVLLPSGRTGQANDTKICTKLARLSAAQAGRPGPPASLNPLVAMEQLRQLLAAGPYVSSRCRRRWSSRSAAFRPVYGSRSFPVPLPSPLFNSAFLLPIKPLDSDLAVAPKSG